MIIPDLPHFGLWYDFRNPIRWRRPFGQMYQQYLDQIERAEDIGFSSVWLTEHHFCDDGYTPSPFIIASAIGQRTKRLRIGTNLIILPIHDPIRVAEDAATLSLLTNGRFDLGIGAGYKVSEFEQFGRDIRHRPSLLEEGVEIIRRAWAGEVINFEGKRFTVRGHVVTPQPEIVPRLFIGGMARPAIERAARIGDGFLPSGDMGIDHYLQTLERVGKNPADGLISMGCWAIISPDPEAEADRIGEHLLYQMNEYIRWGAFGPVESTPEFPDANAALSGGLYRLWDADAAVDYLQNMIDTYPQITDIHFWAQFPGETVESGQRRLDYIAAEVLPRLRPSSKIRDKKEAS